MGKQYTTVVHYCDSGAFGGTEQALLHLLTGLDRRVWRPVLFHHPEPGIRPLLEGVHGLGIETRAIPRMQGMSAISALPQFVRQLRSERPAIFHAHLAWLLSCKHGLVAAELARVPAIIATAQQYMLPPWKRTTYFQHRLVAAGVHRYIAVSQAVARQLCDSFHVPACKIEVVRNSIPFSLFDRPAGGDQGAGRNGNAGEAVVLTVARLDKQKGHCYLLEAAAQVPKATFLLAGEGPERQALEQQALSLGLEDRVKFLGHRKDIPDLLAGCDIFVLPSIYEGLPLSILEAMASGKPVVATAVCGNPEAVAHEETGLLVPPQDSASLAAAMNRLLSEPSLARKMGISGRARARQDFSASTMVQQISHIYEALLGSTPSRSCAP